WQVLKTVHTAAIEPTDFRGAWVANDTWLATQGFDRSPGANRSGYERNNLLIGLPGLEPGPGCVSTRLEDEFGQRRATKVVDTSLNDANDAACREVLNDAGVDSVATLEAQIYTGHSVPPGPGRLPAAARYVGWARSYGESLWDDSPFESTSHHWYD